MNLLDKYMVQVGKHLPRKNRLDLQAEIRSTIEDMLEDRSQQSGRAIDDALISEVLLEYGAPEKVAASYKPTRYLIGPRLYPIFKMVLKIVISVLTAVAIIGFTITFVSSGMTAPAFIIALKKFGLDFLGGVISAFGNIVLVFAIMERVLPESKFEEEAEKWVPADLNAESDPDQITRGEIIFEILFTMLGLAIFNLYPNVIGLATVKDNIWVFFPALSDVFFRYLPWINLLGLLQILLDLYLLRQNIWRTVTRLITLAIGVAGIVLAGIMLLGPSLVNLDANKLALTFGEAANLFLGFFNFLPQMVLIILIIVQTTEGLQIVWRLINQRNSQKTFFPK